MLVNVKFYKIFAIFILLSVNLSANEKDQIIDQLNNLNSLEFTFDQIINDKTEKGNCLLEFPGKLKCDYFDDKKKELIINNKKLELSERFEAQLKLNKLPNNSAKIRIRNRCEVSGRPHGVYRKLRISRIALRDLASAGKIPGITKSSW